MKIFKIYSLLLVLVVVLHAQWVWGGGILGAPQSDVIRGVWGLDQQARGLPVPFWTDRVGFPEGSKLLVLPFASSLIGAPLVWALGAPLAWSLWVMGLLWASGCAAARLAQEWLESEEAGWIAGCAMISQPMLWMAMTDGTAENVAFWSVPLLLLLLLRAVREGSAGWAAAAGGMATVVALDSPYHAIFVLPLLVPIIGEAAAGVMQHPAPLRYLRETAVRVGVPLVLVSGAGAGICYGLYYGLPVSSAPPADLSNNAVRLATWLQWEQGKLREPWDWTLAPTFVPLPLLIGGPLLGLASLRRALPWVAVAALCVLLSLGPDRGNAAVAAQAIGGWAGAVVDGWASFSHDHPIPVVRFLRRWLVPAALCLALAAEAGLASVRAVGAAWGAGGAGSVGGAGRWSGWIGPALGIGLVAVSAWKTGYPQVLPRIQLEMPASTRFIADHPASGHILILPRVRAARRLQQRDELPVFASLSQDLTSSAELWLQVCAERGAVNSPVGLLTMVPRRARSAAYQTLLRDLDDLTLPQTIGNPIPPSATMEPARRQETARAWVTDGLRFLLVDEEIYAPEGLRLLRETFGPLISDERHFDDGTGVTVMILSP